MSCLNKKRYKTTLTKCIKPLSRYKQILPRLKLYFGGLGDLGLGGSELVEIGRLDGDVKSDL